MIENTESYKKLKAQIQDSIDFVLLSCHAVPALKGYIKAVERGGSSKIPDPDFFGGPTNHMRLKEIAPGYKKILGRFLILSSFSYFEAYVSNVFKEIFDFQGGESEFIKRATSRRDQIIAVNDPNLKKLREKRKKGKQGKYEDAYKALNGTGFRFPTDLLATYGILHLQNQIKTLRAANIPDVVQNALGLTMTKLDIENFDRIRALRNDVAHGKTSEVDLRQAIEDNRLLRSLAVKIDEHIVKHFFVIEI